MKICRNKDEEEDNTGWSGNKDKCRKNRDYEETVKTYLYKVAVCLFLVAYSR